MNFDHMYCPHGKLITRDCAECNCGGAGLTFGQYDAHVTRFRSYWRTWMEREYRHAGESS